jgi:outer membrane biosynthesis protein TonB
MQFLETPEEKKSFAITSGIFAILLLIVIFFGLTYMDPPPENGIAINFGTSDVGQGEIQPTEPIKSSPQQPVQPETSQNEDVLSQDEDSPVVVPTKKETPKPKETPKETPKPKVEKPKPSKETSNALDALLNGPKTDGKTEAGHGKDGLPGDKGDPLGSIYTDSFYGNGSGSGKGYGLSGRNLAVKGKVVEQCGNESGRVIVQITVNRNGDVIKTQYVKGTTNTTPCVLEAAYKTAKNYKWQLDSKAPDTQIGWIEVNFTIGE